MSGGRVEFTQDYGVLETVTRAARRTRAIRLATLAVVPHESATTAMGSP
jgi:hypothetical protein